MSPGDVPDPETPERLGTLLGAAPGACPAVCPKANDAPNAEVAITKNVFILQIS